MQKFIFIKKALEFTLTETANFKRKGFCIEISVFSLKKLERKGVKRK